jgi:hypothetical protein
MPKVAGRKAPPDAAVLAGVSGSIRAFVMFLAK